MEVVAATPTSGSPFHNHDVREWSRLDSLTGVLERARLETDHWSANTATTSHKYNKVVDSRARSGADGNVQQQARRQFEVFQSKVPGGRLQVIKTQTVSSSRWTNKSPTATVIEAIKNGKNDFEDLQLPLNPLDLSSEKSKASVGRSVGRRPPSRSRIRDDILSRNNLHTTATTNLHRVSRLCHQIHDSAVKQTFGKYSPTTIQPSISERQNGDGVEINEIGEHETHNNLSRTKSTSSDDLQENKKSLDDLHELDDLQSWRRTSKIRRSLQYPKHKTSNNKPPDLPQNLGSVRKIREDLETGRRLSTALRGNNVDLDALDQILKSISNSSVSSSNYSEKLDEPEKDEQITAKKQKRNSFVTVESIQAVRDKLRRTSSPTTDIYSSKKEDEGIDDGMLTESTVNLKQLSEMSSNESRVKSYVYGMEHVTNKPISGTGSLESRSKINNSLLNRNEDWFSRRKSYGFEQMHNQPETMASKNKSRIESSTDSGICRSTEIVLVPTSTKSSVDLKYNDYTSGSDEEIKQVFREDIKNQVNSNGSVKKYSLLFENKRDDPYSSKKAHEELTTIWNKRGFNKDNGVNATIPVTTNGKSFETNELNDWNGDIKRHSIAVDESKYMTSKLENKFKRTSLATNDKNEEDDEMTANRKSNKKVEFCKTEVHFAADSGRVNIVETDEKPPPTHNFRRRRRNTGIPEDYNKNGLPMLHFGDTSYEKILFGDPDEAIYENVNKDIVACGNVTVNVNGNYQRDYEEYKDSIEETPRGILKNKPIKPKPYILGDTDDLLKSTDSENEKTWGVRLRPTMNPPPIKEDTPIWRSTVTVRNTSFEPNENNAPEIQPEFQKLLKHLRPTSIKKDEVPVENKRNSENLHSLNVLSPPIDTRRSSWSVADRIKQVEDLKWTENKGYSTKVNFGDGEATVVENRHPTWPRRDDYSKDTKKNLLNKGLVVRIGRNDSNSTHTVCSKTTTNCDTHGMTTTTKITIDLTPSPTNDNDFKFPRAALQSFKSPSLIMNTIKNECYNSEVANKIKISPHLEVLRKLYEDHSDSEADKEVHQILMSKSGKHEQDDSSSVISGSWSKMRAFKHVSQCQKSVKQNGSHVLLEKDANARLTPEREIQTSKFQLIDEQIEKDLKFLNQEAESLNKSKYSPVILRKLNNVPLKSAFTNTQKLSSPFLVQNRSRNNSYNSETELTKTYEQNMKNIQETIKENVDRGRSSSPTKVIVRNKSPSKDQVLRQPKKSEMAYFGIDVSAKPLRNSKLTEKPDLLQFNSISEKKKNIYTKREEMRAPIYENLDPLRKPNKFDSSILEELTKAADQILHAVNGYTDEEYHSKYSTDDEKSNKRETLDTISETKSWKQTKTRTLNSKLATTKSTKLKTTSSNSSIDSISREFKKTTPIARDPKKPFMTKSAEQKQRKKVVASETTAVKSTTKARRLQRASSREALLQSHGSSSEDITTTVEVVRKPRLIKKTKVAQLTVTNGMEMKKPSVVKKREEIKAKHEERVPVIGLPEIRHKTAISTIRSTAEKQASRDKVKSRGDEKKRYISKRADTKGVTNSTTKSEKIRSSASHRDATLSHRLPSSNIVKKSTRTEVSSKH